MPIEIQYYHPPVLRTATVSLKFTDGVGVTASVREVDDNRLRLDKEVNSRRSDEGKKTARWKLNKLNSEVAGEILCNLRILEHDGDRICEIYRSFTNEIGSSYT